MISVQARARTDCVRTWTAAARAPFPGAWAPRPARRCALSFHLPFPLSTFWSLSRSQCHSCADITLRRPQTLWYGSPVSTACRMRLSAHAQCTVPLFRRRQPFPHYRACRSDALLYTAACNTHFELCKCNAPMWKNDVSQARSPSSPLSVPASEAQRPRIYRRRDRELEVQCLQ